MDYFYLPTLLVPLRDEMVMWSTDSSCGVVDTQTESQKITRAQIQWHEIQKRRGVTPRALYARRQKGGFFRCHYIENNCVYSCIFEERPTAMLNVGRVEPRDKSECVEYDSLAPISLTFSNNNVLWDTSFDELKDEGELEKIRLEHEKKMDDINSRNPHHAKSQQRKEASNRALAQAWTLRR